MCDWNVASQTVVPRTVNVRWLISFCILVTQWVFLTPVSPLVYHHALQSNVHVLMPFPPLSSPPFPLLLSFLIFTRMVALSVNRSRNQFIQGLNFCELPEFVQVYSRFPRSMSRRAFSEVKFILT